MFNAIYKEVVRRQMPQTVGAYLVVAISILTAADLFLPVLPVSEELYGVLVWVLMGLIPVVVLLSWFFNITRDGIRRSASGQFLLDAKNVSTPWSTLPLDSTIEMEAALANDFSAAAINGITIDADNFNGDIHASPEYRAHLLAVMAARAVTAAAA